MVAASSLFGSFSFVVHDSLFASHFFFFLRLIQNYFELDSGIYIDTELTLLLFLADMHLNGCSQALSGTDGRS